MTAGNHQSALGDRHRQLQVWWAATGVATLAWLLLFAPGLAGVGMHVLRPAAQPFTAEIVLFGWLMWMLMMAAMMLPPVVPWLVAYASVARSPSRTVLFGGGYFTVWGAASFIAAVLQPTLINHDPLRGLLAGTQTGLGAALLIGAGLYQLLPPKTACLKHCRSPMSFFLTSWRGGRWGAFRMGTEHGAYCVGCCWALMALAFAIGVMNLVWMAALTVMLCIEKIAPRGEVWSRAFGAVLVLWGAWVAFGP